MSDIDRIKQKILIASRVLYAPNGITDVQEGFSGHVSRRLPGGGSYVVAGHTHVESRSTIGDVGCGDLVVVDMETGTRMEGSQPLLGENVIHMGVYRAREDVNSVIHVHPFWCTVWSLVENRPWGYRSSSRADPRWSRRRTAWSSAGPSETSRRSCFRATAS